MIDRTEFDLRLAAHHRQTATVERHGWKPGAEARRSPYRVRVSRALLRAALWLAPPTPAAEPQDVAWAVGPRR